MNCCEKCFKDVELKAIIRGKNKKGTCDICGSRRVYVYDMNNNNELRDNFEQLLDIYSTSSERPDEFPQSKMNLLKNILAEQWNIFNLNSEDIYRFLISILPEKYSEQPELFDEPVGLFDVVKEDYLQEYSVLGTYNWKDFVKEIKEKNRFHTDIINKELFSVILQSAFKKYKKGSVFWRARICKDKYGFKPREMGAPPPNVASSGRANSEGISCLYLAGEKLTTLKEIRAGLYDYVTIGRFRLLQDIEVINLAEMDQISPFKDLDVNLIAANIDHLNKISQDIAKPLRRFDSQLDYLPTQYICDFIKSKGFDGIEYRSTMSRDGINYAIFNEKLLKCTKTTVYDINSIAYDYTQIK